jgi:type IV pilus assembly protein PilV
MMSNRLTGLTGPLHRGCQGGFSIVEVLVALLVLAIGLLGLAALQAQGLRFNHDAYVRTQATHLAYDIVDRMRVNRTNLAAYTAGPPPMPFDCDPTVSTVAMDLECWYDGLANALPGGSGFITSNAAANYYDVTVRWIDRTPRDFGGGAVRAPASQADCDTIAGRFWDGANCLVQQTWTVWP